MQAFIVVSNQPFSCKYSSQSCQMRVLIDQEEMWMYQHVTTNQPGTFTCKRTRCKSCPFISNTVNISGPNRSVKVTDYFTCISTNVIYCITCTLCKKIYIGEIGRRLADRFREHLRDVEKNNTDASKPVARHFNLRNHSHHNMSIWGLSLHHGNTESRKSLEQKFIFPLGTLSPHGIIERLSFH